MNEELTPEGKEALDIIRRDKAFQDLVKTLGVGFNTAFCVLGSIALILNLLVLYVIISHRRQTFKSAFYTLLANVAVTDALRAICLLIWAGRVLSTSTKSDFSVEASALYLLRFFNVVTALNITLLTLNEFFAIKYPVRYKRYDSPGKATLIPVAVSWIIGLIAIGFTVWARKSRENTLLVRKYNGTYGDAGIIPKSHVKPSQPVDSTWSSGVELGILLFSIACFVVVLTCYAWFFQKLRLRHQDVKFRRETPFLRIHFGGPAEYAEANTNSATCRVVLRYKYILVIGLVVLVYSFYLVSYAAITLLQIAGRRVSRYTESYHVARLCLQLAVVLHTILQPLCYLRFRQFCSMTLKTFHYTPSRTARQNSRNSTRSTSVLSKRSDAATQVDMV